MIYRSHTSNLISKSAISLIFILLINGMVLFITGCSEPELKDETREALPQYLEELKIEQNEQETRYAALLELHNLEPETYVIGSGNEFDIQVFAFGEIEDEYTTNNAIVKSDRTISINYLDEDIYILGMTMDEARNEIKKHITEIYDPRVAMNPQTLQSSFVTIMGQAQEPGNYPIYADMKLLDALAEARGFASGLVKGTTKELADLSGSFIVRDNKVLPVDFLELVRKGSQLNNIPLKGGDYIFISSLANQELYILGEIVSPNAYLYKENLSLIQLVAFAGGFAENAQSNVYLIRGTLSHPRVFIVDTDAILHGNSRDVILKPNDIVYVPRTLLGDWNQIVSQILPSLQAIQSGYIVNSIFDDIINNK
ncbi:MAG: SLBB domain-containing protein [Candidatus Stygibacter frigidus]|nr:SLBB domain-containing protein [Candidatus Stygibacter frigidus]